MSNFLFWLLKFLGFLCDLTKKKNLNVVTIISDFVQGFLAGAGVHLNHLQFRPPTKQTPVVFQLKTDRRVRFKISFLERSHFAT